LLFVSWVDQVEVLISQLKDAHAHAKAHSAILDSARRVNAAAAALADNK
jgi:hypothetical protein